MECQALNKCFDGPNPQDSTDSSGTIREYHTSRMAI